MNQNPLYYIVNPELFMEQYLNGRDCTMNPQKLIHAANYPHPHEKKGIKSL